MGRGLRNRGRSRARCVGHGGGNRLWGRDRSGRIHGCRWRRMNWRRGRTRLAGRGCFDITMILISHLPGVCHFVRHIPKLCVVPKAGHIPGLTAIMRIVTIRK